MAKPIYSIATPEYIRQVESSTTVISGKTVLNKGLEMHVCRTNEDEIEVSVDWDKVAQAPEPIAVMISLLKLLDVSVKVPLSSIEGLEEYVSVVIDGLTAREIAEIKGKRVEIR